MVVQVCSAGIDNPYKDIEDLELSGNADGVIELL